MGVLSKMSGSKGQSLLSTLAFAVSVAAHGHISNVIINGVSYVGFNSPRYYRSGGGPDTFAWTIDQTDNGFVSPDAYGDPDIICHRSATPAQFHVEVAAGDTLSLQWTPWPESHHGPVIDYLANCNGPCEDVDKTSLEFFKIDAVGIIDQGNPGYYAADVLIDEGNTWEVKIPESIAPGNYVLRHEIIALHSAGQVNGAQNYPQCFNLVITGSGSDTPSGTLGTDLYNEDDPGIEVSIYTSSLDYQIPGPSLIAGVPSSVEQEPSTATASASPTPSGEGGNGGSPPSNNPPATTTADSGSGPTTTMKAPTTTSMATKTTPAPGGGDLQTVYGQCGGKGWSGPTACADGVACTTLNAYYAQCAP